MLPLILNSYFGYWPVYKLSDTIEILLMTRMVDLYLLLNNGDAPLIRLSVGNMVLYRGYRDTYDIRVNKLKF